MTQAPHTADQDPAVPTSSPDTGGLARRGALAGAVAAVGVTLLAAIARATDVPLEVDGTDIPIAAFAWWTAVGAALGIVAARLLRERRRFVVVTTIATGLSLLPAIAAPDDGGTSLVLVATHLIAAAIVIPALARRLAPAGQPG